MSELDIQEAKSRRYVDQYIDKYDREKKIRKYESELGEVQDEMNSFMGANSKSFRIVDGVMQSAAVKTGLYSVVAGGTTDALRTVNNKVADSIGWALEKGGAANLRMRGVPKERAENSIRYAFEPIIENMKLMDKYVPQVDYQTNVNVTDEQTGEVLSRPSYWETVPRSMVQFFTLYGPALSVLRTQGAGVIAGDIGAGAVADMMAFENKQGTLSDFARYSGFDNELTQFLSGELSDNEFTASLKAATEGAGIGLAFGLLQAGYRGIKSAVNAGNKYSPPTRVKDFVVPDELLQPEVKP